MGHVLRSEEQQIAVDALRRFLDAEAEALFNREYRDRFVPREVMAAMMRRLAEFGLVSGAVSEAHGGLGLDWLTTLMLFEEVAATSVDLSVPVLINCFGAHMIANIAATNFQPTVTDNAK